MLTAILAGAAGALACGLIVWLLARSRITALETRLDEREKAAERAFEALRMKEARYDSQLADQGQRFAALQAERDMILQERERLAADLDAERRATAEKLSVLEKAERQLREAFEAACQHALQTNNQTFLDLAQARFGELQQAATSDLEARRQAVDDMIKPVREGIQRVGETLQKLDVDRAATHAAIHEQLQAMAQTGERLAGETQTLVRALRTPQVRGQWGEMQLRRAVELAGMVEHCDFVAQPTVQTEDGRRRPDLLVRLPGSKLVVVDSKAPLDAFLDAQAAEDDATRNAHLNRHARQVRDHITRLGEKEYADQFAEAPDFVVMFLPGEAFFSEACRRDPSLIDYAIGKGVMPASPITLITLLKAVAFGWQQERLAENAEQLRDLGLELYGRVRIVAEHLAGIRKGLEAAVEAYNKTVGSLEGRFLPTARKLKDLGIGAEAEVPVLETVDTVPRLPAAVELRDVEPSYAATAVPRRRYGRRRAAEEADVQAGP